VAGLATLDLNVHRLAGKIISSLPRWLLNTMMIMVILTRDLAFSRILANDDQLDGPCVDDRLLHRLLWAIVAGPAAGRRFRSALASYCVPGSVLQLAMVPQPRLNPLGQRGQVVAAPPSKASLVTGVTGASALISQTAISYTRCGCCGQHIGIMSPTSQTYSVTNQLTIASSQHNNCCRYCGVRQVAGSHGRGSNRVFPTARI
jgi:hypothetical protein